MTSPEPIRITPFELAQRFVGVVEVGGGGSHPLIAWWLSLCGIGTPEQQADDSTAWCSTFVNGIAWELRLPRSKSAAARSWLNVGTPIPLTDAVQGFDVVVLWRGSKTAATGHVGFFAGTEGDTVLLLGGNQRDAVSVAAFPIERVLGVRRLK